MAWENLILMVNMLKKCSTGQSLSFRNDSLENPHFKVAIPSVTQDSFIALKTFAIFISIDISRNKIRSILDTI